ncbi:hypothetical protein EC179100_5538 [Escherichia coli 179100]|nr:hypothetical protein EC179100_5538 [Escherichia coli 179100]
MEPTFTPFGNSIPDDGFTACKLRAAISGWRYNYHFLVALLTTL